MKKLISRAALTKVVIKATSCHSQSIRDGLQSTKKRDVTSKLLILKQFINRLEEQEKSILKMIATESGRPIHYLKEEIQEAKDALNHIGNNLDKQLGKHPIEEFPNAYIKYKPLGTILYVPSWRLPIFQNIVSVVSNLLLGNCVIMHTPKLLPSTFDRLQKMMAESGWHNGQFQTIITHENQLQYILNEPCISGIHISGKKDLVKSLSAKAGQKLKKSVARVDESLGNFIVFNNADIKLAVKLAIKSICKFGGQDAYSPKAFFVMEEVYDYFKDTLISELNKLVQGPPTFQKTQYGPLIAIEEIKDFYKESIKIPIQWRLIFRSQKLNRFYPITVFETSQDMSINMQKLTGPVICLHRVGDMEDLQQMTLEKQCLFSICVGDEIKDHNIVDFIEKLPTNTVCLNALPSIQYNTPVTSSGVNGYGADLGIEGFKQFANIKLYYKN